MSKFVASIGVQLHTKKLFYLDSFERHCWLKNLQAITWKANFPQRCDFYLKLEDY